MEQRGVQTIPGYALRTNSYYTDKVGIYTEVWKQRWIWRGVTHGGRLHIERGYIQRRFRLEETFTHRRGTWENARHTEGGAYTKGYHATIGAPPLCRPCIP